MELLSDYDCEIRYHPGKANVVADTLSRKENIKPSRVQASGLWVRTSLRTQILNDQDEAMKSENVKNETLHNIDQRFEKDGDGIHYFKKRAWVP